VPSFTPEGPSSSLERLSSIPFKLAIAQLKGRIHVDKSLVFICSVGGESGGLSVGVLQRNGESRRAQARYHGQSRGVGPGGANGCQAAVRIRPGGVPIHCPDQGSGLGSTLRQAERRIRRQ